MIYNQFKYGCIGADVLTANAEYIFKTRPEDDKCQNCDLHYSNSGKYMYFSAKLDKHLCKDCYIKLNAQAIS